MTIILITNTFPYKSGESFLIDEMVIASDKDCKIVIYPLSSTNEIMFNSNSYKNLSVYNKTKQTLFPVITIFLKNIFVWFSEIRKLFREKRLNSHTLKWSLSFFVNAVIINADICKIIGKTNGAIAIYSYWASTSALAAVMINNNRIKKYSRIHRIDLYEELHDDNYIPYREFIYSNLTCLFSISDNGIEYITNRYRNANINLKVSRLGTRDCGINTGYRTDTIVIVSCSNVTAVKCVPLIYDSISSVEDYKFKWIHFGTGPEIKQLEDRIHRSANKNLEVCLMGYQTKNKIMEWYANNYIDLFINASKSEGVPVSIMEAYSFGIPAIATDVGGTSEIVNNENGWLVSGDNVKEQITAYIHEYCKMNNNHVKNKRRLARKMWEERYSANYNYDSFYDEILNNNW